MTKQLDLDELADKVAYEENADVFIFNGDIDREYCLNFAEVVDQKKTRDNVVLILVTYGGDPDAAFKMARYLQMRYDRFTLLVCGLCKSAGTLIAIGANRLIFTPYGELGPLDIQMVRTDHIERPRSGLTTGVALVDLEDRAQEFYFRFMQQMMASGQGHLSVQMAATTASQFVGGLYGKIFESVDPDEVGERAMSMRIGLDYGTRLHAVSQSMKGEETLDNLVSTYSSHSFVIDRWEAESLFNAVEEASASIMKLVKALGSLAREPQGGYRRRPTLRRLNTGKEAKDGSGKVNGAGASQGDGDDSREADGAPPSSPTQPVRGSKGSSNGKTP